MSETFPQSVERSPRSQDDTRIYQIVAAFHIDRWLDRIGAKVSADSIMDLVTGSRLAAPSRLLAGVTEWEQGSELLIASIEDRIATLAKIRGSLGPTIQSCHFNLFNDLRSEIRAETQAHHGLTPRQKIHEITDLHLLIDIDQHLADLIAVDFAMNEIAEIEA